MVENLRELLVNAEQDIAKAQSVAETDPTRPRFHFRAPGQWMDDPNGIIFHNGQYHVMYSLNPNSSTNRAGMVYKTVVRVWDPDSDDWTGGVTVWGHSRSSDLVHWEHLPIAIYPQIDKGEHFVWFGCTTITPSGIPMVIYTAVGPDLRPEDTAEQWAAYGSDDLLRWDPVQENPLMDGSIHGDQPVSEWRDPFVFVADGKTYMILGGRTGDVGGGEPVVLLYEAEDPDNLLWEYRGILYRHPTVGVPSVECPNLVKLGDKWVLFLSLHGPVEYVIGELDLNGCTFTTEFRGIADHSSNYYATNIMRDNKDRDLLWGALVGFEQTKGWNGALAIPRELDLRDGLLRMKPIDELASLRIDAIGDVRVDHEAPQVSLGSFPDGVGELRCELRTGESGTLILRLGEGGSATEVVIGRSSLRVNEKAFQLNDSQSDKSVTLYFDRTVLEVFVGDTDCAVLIVPAQVSEVPVSVSVEHNAVAMVKGWSLQSEGLFTVSEELAAVREG